jgi:hypothetical protein
MKTQLEMVETHLNVSQMNICKLYQITKQKDNVCIFVVKMEGVKVIFKEYKKMFPKRNIYVISSIAEDKSIDSLKPKRIDVMHSEFMFDEFTAEDFKDSLVIADDVDVFQTKVKKKVLSIINSILQIGRHFNVSLCFTTHNLTIGAETKVLLAEAHIITLFPKTTGSRALKYILDAYLGIDKSQITKLKKMKSRAVSIIRGYPQVVIGEQEAFLADEL